jgi:hypothetical protein
MANKYLDGSLLSSRPGAAPPPTAQPSTGNKYLNGSVLSNTGSESSQQVDKYHQHAQEYLAQHPEARSGVGSNFVHGATAGISGRLAAGLHTIGAHLTSNDGMSFPERMRYGVAMEQERHNQSLRDHPIAGNAAEMAGAVLSPVGRLAGRGVSALTNSRFANAVGQGVAQGGTEGLMDTGTVEGGARGAGWGGVGGAVGYGVGRAVEGVANKFAPQVNVPSMSRLQADAADAEQRFVDSGVTYDQPALDYLQTNIQNTLEGGRYSPTNHPNLAGSNMLPSIDDVVNRTPRPFQQVPEPLPYQKTHPITRGPEDIRDISRVVQENQGGSMRPSENRLLGQVQETVRNFPEAVSPSHVLSGDSAAAGSAWREANDLYTRQFKTQALRDAIEQAADKARVSGSGGNIDNLTRKAAMTVRDSRHDWTPDEMQHLDTIMQGDDSWLRTLGRAAPQGNGLLQFEHLKNILMGGGDPKAALLALASQAARFSTDNSTQANVTRLDQLIRNGGQASNTFPAQTAAQRIAPQFTQNLPGPFAQLFAGQAAPATVDRR